MKRLPLNLRHLRQMLPMLTLISVTNTANFMIHTNLYVNLPQQPPVPTQSCPVKAEPK
ncbi:MAG: hypothetical protein KME25_13405 [Symplocastrum torsivum CPER-KK1]|jgi:hypothetical protein|uniref:Uncharacterized protein n=1 Tax=Symplocastrum torsivum CPER-KK1 TaxID=450513 RepID=A0A951PLH5_9CYAN|nr:hypothetical protein [Symplocastrum torsivum CPER-KK1]